MSKNEKKFMTDERWAEIQSKWNGKKPEFKQVSDKAEFKKDLGRGKSGEHSFYQKYQHCISMTDGRRGDFEINKTGEIIELKTDYFDPEKTPNFFMERYSYNKAPGGPWQAKEHGASYYVYKFDSSDKLYIFNVDQLLKKLKKLESIISLTPVKNLNYTTYGYKVPRELLADILLEPEEIGLHTK